MKIGKLDRNDLSHLEHPSNPNIEPTDSYQHNEPKGVTIYESRTNLVDECPTIFNRSNREVDILGTGLTSFLWGNKIKDAIQESINRNIKFRILIMDPFYQFQGQEKSFKEGQIDAITRWINCKNNLKNRKNNRGEDKFLISVYKTNTLVKFLMVVDNHLFFSPCLLLPKKTPKNKQNIYTGIEPSVGNNSKIIESYKLHFNAIWEDANPIEEYEQYIKLGENISHVAE